MRNSLIILIAILSSLSACKDDCLSCPENEAVINGQCRCVGISFQGNCISKSEAFTEQYLHSTSDLFKPFYSEAVAYNTNFDFDNQPVFIYLSDVKEYNGKLSSILAIQTESRPSATYFDKVYYAGIESLTSWNSKDSFYYNGRSGNIDYMGFVYCGYGNFGWDNGDYYTTQIDGQTCYLRPYLKILDKDYIRVTFRYETADNQVKAECVRRFHR